MERHPSLDDRFDPAIRIVEHDPAWHLFVPTGESPDFLFFAKPPERPRTHHLHVCEAGSEHELRHPAVRDFLRTHPDEAAGYEALKRGLAARHPQDRLSYIEGKDEYMAGLEARALQWAHLGT